MDSMGEFFEHPPIRKPMRASGISAGKKFATLLEERRKLWQLPGGAAAWSGVCIGSEINHFDVLGFRAGGHKFRVAITKRDIAAVSSMIVHGIGNVPPRAEIAGVTV